MVHIGLSFLGVIGFILMLEFIAEFIRELPVLVVDFAGWLVAMARGVVNFFKLCISMFRVLAAAGVVLLLVYDLTLWAGTWGLLAASIVGLFCVSSIRLRVVYFAADLVTFLGSRLRR